MIVALGGGKGLSSTVRALKHIAADFSVVVAVTDNGGSTGVLRRRFGIPAVGDIRRVIDYLSNERYAMYFEHRPIDNHPVGNLLLTSYLLKGMNLSEAAAMYRKVLNVHVQVEPQFLEAVDLCASFGDAVVCGEEQINDQYTKPDKMWITPEDAGVNPRVLELLDDSEIVILGPGSLYTSIIPHLLNKEMLKLISQKKVILITNISNEGITDGFKLSDYVNEVSKYVEPDVVIANDPVRYGNIEVDLSAPWVIKKDIAKDDYFHDYKRLGEVLWNLLFS